MSSAENPAWNLTDQQANNQAAQRGKPRQNFIS